MKKYLPYVIGLLAALILSIGIGFGLSLQDNNDSEQKIEEPPVKDSTSSVVENFKPVERQSGALNVLDLSLDKFTIGDSEEKVYKILGQPNAK